MILASMIGVLGGFLSVPFAKRFCHSGPTFSLWARFAWAAVFFMATVSARAASADDRLVVVMMVWAAVLQTVAMVDLVERRIPNSLTRSMTVGLFALAAVATVSLPEFGLERLASASVGSILFGTSLLAVHLLRPDGMGLGDVKLAYPLGGLLGWCHGDVASVTVVISLTLAAACALGLGAAALSWNGDARMRETRVAFGPSIAAAGTMALIAVVPG